MSQDLNRYFQEEAEDLLRRITTSLEALRQEPATPEGLRELRRWTHTLKGAAQVVRREEIARSAHRLETLLDRIAESGGPGIVEEALHLAAGIARAMIPRPQQAPAEPTAQQPAVPAAEIDSLRVDLRELDSLLQTIGESAILASGLRRLFEPLGRARDLAAGLAGTTAQGNAGDVAEQIEDMLTEVRRELDLLAERIQGQLDGLRARTENLRLVRAETIVPVLEQSVKAAAASAGKAVEFFASGGELEMDAHVLIVARDALIQIGRNAVAHGIESPEERVEAGKPAAGRVRVEFRREGAGHVVALSDDGRGIDFESLRRQAVRRGWLSEAAANQASSQDLTQFLLRPGVTTARSASVLAGRGVGLDLVSNMVARLKGELRISAEPGQGTTVEMRVPAHLNSALVLMLVAGGMELGIPLDAVRGASSALELRRFAEGYLVDGRVLPMLPLASVFGGTSAPSAAVEIAAHPEPFLLGVESLQGIRQTVIHMLPDYLEAEPYVLGATIESEGNLRLILDPAMLSGRLAQFAAGALDAPRRRAPELPILVIDDSLTTRMLEQSIFEMEGYTVHLASSAEEGLAMARQRKYGLFLVDVEMPGVDGFTFVERTRREPELRNTPAILVTSRGSAEDRARGIEAGAQGYVVKSEFDQGFLLNRVRELMAAR